ncbi:hypothetical protein JW826_02635 [Candidatus Woesearchaeota archaeon]|nr:hypothetical protein [Candidatus Woesearchaeota archaeon]
MKKGIMYGTLVTVVLVVAALIVLIIFLVNTNKSIANSLEDEECASSIVSHSTLLRVSGGSNAPNILCPTKYPVASASSPEEVKKAFAEALRVCWGTWGRGELQLFEREGRYCHVCSVIEFRNKRIKADDFSKYLSENIIPASAGKEPETYARYLKYFSTDAPQDEVKKAIEDLRGEGNLDSSKRYAVMFFYAKGEDNIETFLRAISTVDNKPVGGAVAGGVLGGAAAVGGTFLLVSNPAGWTVLAVGAVGIAAGAVVGGVSAWADANDPEYMAMTMITEYDSEKLKRMGCTEVPILQDRQKESLG